MARIRAWWARIRVELTWLRILALPARQRNKLIDDAIRGVPGFLAMTIPDQDAAIARWARDMASAYRRRR